MFLKWFILNLHLHLISIFFGFILQTSIVENEIIKEYQKHEPPFPLKTPLLQNCKSNRCSILNDCKRRKFLCSIKHEYHSIGRLFNSSIVNGRHNFGFAGSLYRREKLETEIDVSNPYHYEYEHMCTVIVLNELWMLTAAHCIIFIEQERVYFDEYRVAVGGGSFTLDLMYINPHLNSRVLYYYRHEKYNKKRPEDARKGFDIGLLKVERKFKLGCLFNIIPASLSFRGFPQQIPNVISVTICGFGEHLLRQHNYVDPDPLPFRRPTTRLPEDRKLNVIRRVFPTDKLQFTGIIPSQNLRVMTTFLRNIRNNSRLVTRARGQTICKGDSGGPLLTVQEGKLRVIGIISAYSPRDSWIFCGETLRSNFFTDLSLYKDIIKSFIGKDLCPPLMPLNTTY